MNTEMIDHTTLTRLVEAGAIHATVVVGQPDGWNVSVKYGTTERLLGAQRSRQVRLFRKLETVVAYLKAIGISHFEVDTANYEPDTSNHRSRPDRAEALRHAHEAAAHDQWFRAQVEAALKEADSPDAMLYTHEEVHTYFAQKRAELLARAAIPDTLATG